MPLQNIPIQMVTLRLGEELELVACQGFPEVSSLGEKAGRGAVGMRSKVKALLEDDSAASASSLYRRMAGRDAQVEQLSVMLEPPKKRADWQHPVELKIDYIVWSEAEDLHLGYVPVLGIQVIAPKLEQIAGRVAAHVRLVLLDRVKRVTLRALASTQFVRGVRVDELNVGVNLKSPREIQEEKGAEKKPDSVLKSVATRITAQGTRPAFELEAVLAQLREALEARQAVSVLLVGPPGVGKTAAVRELGRRGGKAVWSTSGAELIAGQTGFGQWQERCRDLCREAARTRVVLHLGNLAELLEVGQHSANSQSIASFLRPWIERGELLAIAECTPEQLALIERRDPHIAGAFLHVRMPEPSPEVTRRILDSVFRHLARKDSDPSLSAEAIDWLHRLHRRYATYSANPGRPLRFLTSLVAEQPADQKTVLSVDQVTAAFTRETGLPEVLLKDELPLDLEAARLWFSERVIGQPEAIEAVLDLLAMIKARLNRPHQPLASLLFVGPTGTGKTELAKSLAEFLFGSASRLARFDLSEFGDSMSVQRLIGSAGSAEGLLTARVREQPFSVVLLDEFEKADPAFFDLLLQVLGDGRLTDAAGRVADFSNTVVIMTSNLGAREFQRGTAGFGVGESVGSYFEEAARKFLRPEIYNRLGAILRFQPLGEDLMLRVAQRHLGLLRQRDGLKLRDVELRLGPGVEEYLARRGHDPKYGARPLKRVLERELLVPLSEALNKVRHGHPLVAQVSLRTGPQAAGKLLIEVRQRQAKEDAAVSQLALHFAGSALELRRRLGRLARSGTVVALENELPLLVVQDRRSAKRTWRSPDDVARHVRLGHLRERLAQLSALILRMDEIETATLGRFHLDGVIDIKPFARSLLEIQEERQLLQRAFFRLSFPQPDEIVLAFFSEHRDWMRTLLGAYLELVRELGGTLEAIEFFLPGAGRDQPELKPVRLVGAKLADPLAEVPAGWLGALMHLRGDLFHPRFLPESGLHKLVLKGVSSLCLIEASSGKIGDYVAPAGIGRAGTITEKGTRARRVFNADLSLVTDQEFGDSPWARGEPGPALGRLIEHRLTKAVEDLA